MIQLKINHMDHKAVLTVPTDYERVIPQLAGSCLKENQDLIAEILEENYFVFLSVYLTGSSSDRCRLSIYMFVSYNGQRHSSGRCNNRCRGWNKKQPYRSWGRG